MWLGDFVYVIQTWLFLNTASRLLRIIFFCSEAEKYAKIYNKRYKSIANAIFASQYGFFFTLDFTDGVPRTSIKKCDNSLKEFNRLADRLNVLAEEIGGDLKAIRKYNCSLPNSEKEFLKKAFSCLFNLHAGKKVCAGSTSEIIALKDLKLLLGEDNLKLLLECCREDKSLNSAELVYC